MKTNTSKNAKARAARAAKANKATNPAENVAAPEIVAPTEGHKGHEAIAAALNPPADEVAATDVENKAAAMLGETTPRRKKMGVNPKARTRPYYCGLKIGEQGLNNPVGKELFAKVDEAFGDENEYQTSFAARNGWHAIRGYMQAIGLDPLADEAALREWAAARAAEKATAEEAATANA